MSPPGSRWADGIQASRPLGRRAEQQRSPMASRITRLCRPAQRAALAAPAGEPEKTRRRAARRARTTSFVFRNAWRMSNCWRNKKRTHWVARCAAAGRCCFCVAPPSPSSSRVALFPRCRRRRGRSVGGGFRRGSLVALAECLSGAFRSNNYGTATARKSRTIGLRCASRSGQKQERRWTPSSASFLSYHVYVHRRLPACARLGWGLSPRRIMAALTRNTGPEPILLLEPIFAGKMLSSSYRLVSELFMLHPNVPVVFAVSGNGRCEVLDRSVCKSGGPPKFPMLGMVRTRLGVVRRWFRAWDSGACVYVGLERIPPPPCLFRSRSLFIRTRISTGIDREAPHLESLTAGSIYCIRCQCNSSISMDTLQRTFRRIRSRGLRRNKKKYCPHICLRRCESQR